MLHNAPDTCLYSIKGSPLRFRMLAYSVFILVVLNCIIGCTIPLRDVYTNNAVSVEYSQELVNQLSGTWRLQYTAQISGGDTLIDSASMAPRGLTTSPPETEIIFDSLQNFTIKQYCMKCPYINWTGQYFITIEVSNQQAKPYITFAEIRDTYNTRTGQTNSYVGMFNGHLVLLEDNVLQIDHPDGLMWRYVRK